ncbi:MAG: MFS transporter [bacterium]
MWRLLRERNFFLFWSGQGFSEVGTWINFVGLNAYLYHVHNSGRLLALFLIFRLLPSILFGTIGGVLADRYDRRKIMILCDLIRCVLVLFFLFAHDLVTFFVLGFLLSSLDKIFGAALGAYLPNLVEKNRLMEANALRRMTSSVVTVIGPALAGLLIGLSGYNVVFLVDSGSFLVSVLTLLFLRPASTQAPPAGKSPGILKDLKGAYLFMAGKSALIILSLVRMVDALGSGAYNTILPVFAKAFSFSMGSFYGFLIAAWGLGCFAGSLMAGRIKADEIRRRRIFFSAVSLMAIGMLGCFNSPGWLGALLYIGLGGIGDGISSVIFLSVIMEESPEEMRGKIFGTMNAFLHLAVGLGMLLSSFVIGSVPVGRIAAAGSLFIIVGGLAAWQGMARKGMV